MRINGHPGYEIAREGKVPQTDGRHPASCNGCGSAPAPISAPVGHRAETELDRTLHALPARCATASSRGALTRIHCGSASARPAPSVEPGSTATTPRRMT